MDVATFLRKTNKIHIDANVINDELDSCMYNQVTTSNPFQDSRRYNSNPFFRDSMPDLVATPRTTINKESPQPLIITNGMRFPSDTTQFSMSPIKNIDTPLWKKPISHTYENKIKKRKPIKGLEKETLDKQFKYQEIFGDQLDAGDEITFTGMYKYVETGFKDKYDLPIYKRKRIFRKVNQIKKSLTEEQKEEIVQAFYLFDKDKSNSIDIHELKDAMSALGIYMTKEETTGLMEKADKDGSGQLEMDEFIALMSQILDQQNLEF